MPYITLLHANTYRPAYPGAATGFEAVKFPVKVKAEPYRFETDRTITMESLMVVSNDELKRIGYTGPFIDGGLSFGNYNQSFRHASPFDFWNALKASRPVG